MSDMTTAPELSTVSHTDKGRPARPYHFEDSPTGRGATAVGTILVLAAAGYAQRLLFGGQQSHAEQIDDNVEHTGSVPTPETAFSMTPDGDQKNQDQTDRRLPGAPAFGSSGAGGEAAAPPDQDQQDQTHPRGSGATPAHAAAHNDPQDHAGNDNQPHALGSGSSGTPEFHAGGGGGGGGSDSEARRPTSRSGSESSSGQPSGSGAGASNNNPSTDTSGASGSSTSGGTSGNPTSTPPGSRTNRAPIVSGPVVLNDSAMNIAVSISLAALLQNASDPDGDQLAVAGLAASSGDLHDNGDGTWTFTPVAGDDSSVDFHYFISDGRDATAQTAALDLLPVSSDASDPFAGTPDPDVISGTPQDDVIDAKGGDDVVYGSGGNDIMYGGAGNDVLHGDAGDDIIFAGAGDDLVFGGDGNDIIFAGAGNDLVFADAGNDIVYGGAGDDEIHGGSGSDILNGGDGNDRLIGDDGNDSLHGDDGNDTIVATDADGDDDIDGGDGIDTYDLSAAHHRVSVDLAAGLAKGDDTGTDTLSSIENVDGSSGDDDLAGDANANALSGHDGDDCLTGRGGDDVLSGGKGNDTIFATQDDGNDDIDGGDGNDTYDLSATRHGVRVDLRDGVATGAEIGTDRLTSIENVDGGSGDDVLCADEHRNVFAGGDGNDIFVLHRADDDGNPLHWDQIKDFSVGDKIDVSLCPFADSDPEPRSLQFEGPYGGDAAPENTAGKLAYAFAQLDDGEHTLVVGWSSDGASEVVHVDLVGHHALTQSDFIGAH
jgi:Ca2+-binding RTX toxin-like protein